MVNENAGAKGAIFYRAMVIGLLLVAVAFAYEAKENAEMARVNAARALESADSARSAIDDIEPCSRR